MRHVCTWAPSYLPVIGGAEVGLHEVLRSLHATGRFRASVVTATTDPHLKRFEVIDGVEVYRYRRSNRWFRWFGPTLTALRGVPLLRSLRPDLVHVSYILPSGLAGLWAARRLHAAVVVSLVGEDVDDPFHPPPAVLRWLAGRSLRSQASIVANSIWVRQRVAQWLDRPLPTILCIPYGVDVERLRALADRRAFRQHLHLDEATPVVAALQRLEPRKGADVLLRAIRRVHETIPNVQVLVGGRGRDAPKLASLVAELRLDDVVHFVGFVPEADKPSFLASADLFVLPSYHEGLGIVLAEAAALGVPAITTATGGVTTVIEDGTTGVLCRPGDVDGLATAIEALLRDPVRRSAMGTAAAEKIRREMTLSVVVESYERCFDQVVSTHRSA